jgi:ABC-2 type transport system ATP-binding protein
MVRRMLSRLQLRPTTEPNVRAKVTAVPAGRGERGLVLAGVSKRLPRQERPALEDVELTLAPGATASITGPNGAGKTTLLRVLAGLIKPDRGTIHLDGLDSERDGRKYRAKIGFLSAGNTGLFARLSVERHLEYWASVALLPRDEGRRAAARMLDAFGLRELAGRRVDRMSMGQRQRVRAALAFLHEPDLLLLDEPQNSLDAEGTTMLKRTLDEMTARGGSALWCSPAGLSEAGAFDHAFWMQAGRLTRR